ncbi:hypothetical protein NDU88_003348 [Pleurodeles waltl]|uniref:Uncharacterized protein n=1 Tax=Pleurodeles waltl TaxID=8319 RepID=A0AAV7VFT8_PLEWA|nr:hypothetical protein NDU88_003348 [Pleurodeles waltl]
MMDRRIAETSECHVGDVQSNTPSCEVPDANEQKTTHRRGPFYRPLKRRRELRNKSGRAGGPRIFSIEDGGADHRRGVFFSRQGEN